MQSLLTRPSPDENGSIGQPLDVQGHEGSGSGGQTDFEQIVPGWTLHGGNHPLIADHGAVFLDGIHGRIPNEAVSPANPLVGRFPHADGIDERFYPRRHHYFALS